MLPNFNFLMSKMEKNPLLRKRKTLTKFLVVEKSELLIFCNSCLRWNLENY